MLWFTHWRPSRLLALAERLSTTVVSVDERSFPLPSRKLRAIGHGIDVAQFPCTGRPAAPPVRLLALGRYSPAKGLDHVLRAVALVPEAELLVHGPTVTDEERRHRAELGDERGREAESAPDAGACAEGPDPDVVGQPGRPRVEGEYGRRMRELADRVAG